MPRVPGVLPRQHHHHQRLRPSRPGPLPGGHREAAARPRHDRGAAHHAVERRGADLRDRRREAGLHGGVGARRPGVIVSNYIAGELGLRQRDLVRHGRHHGQGRPDPGRPAQDHQGVRGRRAGQPGGRPGAGQRLSHQDPPVIDLVEIGAGGGSIAWVDSGGILRVGPQSAGADPGPICYGQGGEEPTITDANLVLGRLDPAYFLGGGDGAQRRCRPGRYRPALRRAHAARPRGLRQRHRRDRQCRDDECAAGDDRAARLRPERPGHGGVRRRRTAACQPPLHGDEDRVAHRAAQSRDRLGARPAGDGSEARVLAYPDHGGGRGGRRRDRPRVRVHGSRGPRGPCGAKDWRTRASPSCARSRCATRVNPTSWPSIFPAGEAAAGALAGLRERFHTEHDRAYGHGYPDEPTELVNFRLSALGSIRKPRLREIAPRPGPASEARKGLRQVCFDAAGGFVPTPVYDRSRLAAGHRFDGPAIVEEMDSTTLVLPEYTVEVDRYANLLISPVG